MEKRVFTRSEKAQIVKTAIEVRRRRHAIRLRSRDLEKLSGVGARVVERIERSVFNRRCMPPDSPLVAQVIDTLSRIERGELEIPSSCDDSIKTRPLAGRRRSRIKPRGDNGAVTLGAIVKLCPDHECWITQAGCDGLRKRSDICRTAGPKGKACRGVQYRKALDSKRISVRYETPKECVDE